MSLQKALLLILIFSQVNVFAKIKDASDAEKRLYFSHLIQSFNQKSDNWISSYSSEDQKIIKSAKVSQDSVKLEAQGDLKNLLGLLKLEDAEYKIELSMDGEVKLNGYVLQTDLRKNLTERLAYFKRVLSHKQKTSSYFMDLFLLEANAAGNEDEAAYSLERITGKWKKEIMGRKLLSWFGVDKGTNHSHLENFSDIYQSINPLGKKVSRFQITCVGNPSGRQLKDPVVYCFGLHNPVNSVVIEYEDGSGSEIYSSREHSPNCQYDKSGDYKMTGQGFNFNSQKQFVKTEKLLYKKGSDVEEKDSMHMKVAKHLNKCCSKKSDSDSCQTTAYNTFKKETAGEMTRHSESPLPERNSR